LISILIAHLNFVGIDPKGKHHFVVSVLSDPFSQTALGNDYHALKTSAKARSPLTPDAFVYRHLIVFASQGSEGMVLRVLLKKKDKLNEVLLTALESKEGVEFFEATDPKFSEKLATLEDTHPQVCPSCPMLGALCSLLDAQCSISCRGI